MKHLVCAAAIFAALTGTANAAETTVNGTVEYTDFSGDYGNRVVGELIGSAKWDSTTLVLDLAHGRREYADEDFSGTRFGATVYHDWSERLYTQTSVALATNSPLFPSHRLKQDVNLKIGRNVVASAGIGHNRYYGGRDAVTWTAGGSYYFNGGFVSYRYSGYDVEDLGNTHGHLGTVRINDSRGRGQTQLWLGTGTAVHELEVLPTLSKGRLTSVALRRLQPLNDNLALDLTVGHSWYDIGEADYRGTSIRVGFTLFR